MQTVGAKVLHNRCIQIGKKFESNIIAKSTFSNEGGTKICQQIESTEVKSIVKNEKLVTIQLQVKSEYDIYQELLQNNISIEFFQKQGKELLFRIKKEQQNKVQEILDNREDIDFKIKQKDAIKLSIIGYGITQDNLVLNEVMKIISEHKIEISTIHVTQSKIEMIVNRLENSVVEEIHQKIIK